MRHQPRDACYFVFDVYDRANCSSILSDRVKGDCCRQQCWCVAPHSVKYVVDKGRFCRPAPKGQGKAESQGVRCGIELQCAFIEMKIHTSKPLAHGFMEGV